MNFLIRFVDFFQRSPIHLVRLELKIENWTIIIPKGNSYCYRKSTARGPPFKVSSEGLSEEIDLLLRSPIQVQTKSDDA